MRGPMRTDSDMPEGLRELLEESFPRTCQDDGKWRTLCTCPYHRRVNALDIVAYLVLNQDLFKAGELQEWAEYRMAEIDHETASDRRPLILRPQKVK